LVVNCYGIEFQISFHVLITGAAGNRKILGKL